MRGSFDKSNEIWKYKALFAVEFLSRKLIMLGLFMSQTTLKIIFFTDHFALNAFFTGKSVCLNSVQTWSNHFDLLPFLIGTEQIFFVRLAYILLGTSFKQCSLYINRKKN